MWREGIARKMQTNIPPEKYALLFSSVSFDIGRQCGKTSYIREALKTTNSVVICSPTGKASDAYKAFKNRVFTPLQAKRGQCDTEKVDLVFIDDALWLLKDIKARQDLLNALAKDYTTTYVFLG